MKVVILCGGQGTRLREQTEIRPKPMVEIGGRPILWHIMKLYAHHGLTDFVLCLGYKGDVIKRYFLDYEAMNGDFTVTLGDATAIEYHAITHAEAGWRVTLCDTGEQTMTGARIHRIRRHLGEHTFAVTYGDGVGDVDLAASLRFHRAHGKMATLTGVRPPSRFGELDVEGPRVRAFTEKPAVAAGMINGGFFLFEPAFLDRLSDDASCVLERDPLHDCAANNELRVFEHTGYWQCMDTYRDWQELDRLWEEGRAPWKIW